LKKQGDLPEYEELRVNSTVPFCKGLVLKLAEKVTAAQLENCFGTAISKPGELIDIDGINSQGS
jgi:hypothetical protein